MIREYLGDSLTWTGDNGVNSASTSTLQDDHDFTFQQEVLDDGDSASSSQTFREQTINENLLISDNFGSGSITSPLDKPKLLPNHVQPNTVCSRVGAWETEATLKVDPQKHARFRIKKPAAKLPRNEQRHCPKTPHKTIEKRYRTKMNSGFTALQACLPNFRLAEDQSSEEKNGGVRVRKATLLTTAAAHIIHLQSRSEQLEQECKEQKCRLIAYENILIARVEKLN